VFRGLQQYANSGCRLERATQGITTNPNVSRPGQDDISKIHVRLGLEAFQPALLHQVIAELAESKCGLVVAQARPGGHATNPNIGEARAITVAMLQTEAGHATDDRAKEVLVGEQRWH
jgi:hypothetical protein